MSECFYIDERIIEHFSPVTEEEKKILDGSKTIERELYMQDNPNVINSRKLLSSGKLITIRPHTRFIHFPRHTHDYVEMVYMCSGKTTHFVNGKRIELHAGELLIMNQSAAHEICTAGEHDIAVNFIVLPEFFNTALSFIGEEETPLKRFIIDSLCRQNTGGGELHFCVSEVKPIQNLIENLIWTLITETRAKQKTSQMTMALLFMQLLSYTEKLSSDTKEDAAVVGALDYIETNYVSGNLTDAAERLHYDLSWLSRKIKQKTGKTYTELVKEKRLAQAAFLLKSTDRNVDDISFAVGYENVSYFHRIFYAEYGKTPKRYRGGK